MGLLLVTIVLIVSCVVVCSLPMRRRNRFPDDPQVFPSKRETYSSGDSASFLWDASGSHKRTEMTVEYETEFWEALYREFSCSWKYSGSDLVIEYEIRNPTNWPWYGGSSVTLAAVVLDINGNHKSVRTATVQDYELRLFLCQGAIRIPRREVEDGDRICVMVADQ